MTDHPSRTALWVTACRALAGVLPPGRAVCDDPVSPMLAGGLPWAVSPLLKAFPRAWWAVLRAFPPAPLALCWVQLRTRAVDEALVAFAGLGGGQVVLLGAGFDSRGVRFGERFPSMRFFEVDHPATQVVKRARLRRAGLPDAGVRYLPCDFGRGCHDLPSRLFACGLDPSAPVLTIWEGVTFYLGEDEVASSLAAAARWSPPGSRLVFDYIERESLRRRSRLDRFLGRIAFEAREPLRTGFDPATMPHLVGAVGFHVMRDESEAALAGRFLEPGRCREFLSLRGPWRLHLVEAERLTKTARA